MNDLEMIYKDLLNQDGLELTNLNLMLSKY